MRLMVLTAGFLVSYGGGAFGQTAGNKLGFEVASVRAAVPPGPQARGMRGGPGSPDPTRFTCAYCTLQGLLVWAYQLPVDQIAAPSWWTTEYYDIAAKVPEGATKEQFQQMFQNLLADRFKMTVHFVKKDFEAYEMTVAKGGLKMKASVIDPSGPTGLDANGFPAFTALRFKDGFPVLAPGNTPASWGIAVNGRMLFTARQRETGEIATRILENGLALENGPGGAGVRVVDKTGLTGKYDFQFQYALPGRSSGTQDLPPGADYLDSIGEPAPDVVTAARQQLGLTLTKGKVALDVLVVDHAEKAPSAN